MLSHGGGGLPLRLFNTAFRRFNLCLAQKLDLRTFRWRRATNDPMAVDIVRLTGTKAEDCKELPGIYRVVTRSSGSVLLKTQDLKATSRRGFHCWRAAEDSFP